MRQLGPIYNLEYGYLLGLLEELNDALSDRAGKDFHSQLQSELATVQSLLRTVRAAKEDGKW